MLFAAAGFVSLDPGGCFGWVGRVGGSILVEWGFSVENFVEGSKREVGGVGGGGFGIYPFRC